MSAISLLVSSYCRAQELILVLCIEGFDRRTFAEHVSGVVDCLKITKSE